jgi:hypothetical protein
MHEMFESSTLLGRGAVAIWAYIRYPGLRPQSLVRAALHVTVSFLALLLLPELLGLLLPLAHTQSSRIFLAEALLIPALTYLLLSWVWLIARIVELLGGTPRGGHPASNEY